MGTLAAVDQLVLVVDDDEFVRRSLARHLTRLGYKVLSMSNGASAIRMAMERDPAVIFVDLRMPGMAGADVLRQLAARACDASIVVMSGEGQVSDVVGALRLGAVDYLEKPWNTEKLNTVLHRAIDVFRATRESVLAVDARPTPVGT